MTEATGTPLPPPTAPQKTNPWIIIVAVVVVVCGACCGVIGLLLAFGPEVLHELGLYALLPVLTVLL